MMNASMDPVASSSATNAPEGLLLEGGVRVREVHLPKRLVRVGLECLQILTRRGTFSLENVVKVAECATDLQRVLKAHESHEDIQTVTLAASAAGFLVECLAMGAAQAKFKLVEFNAVGSLHTGIVDAIKVAKERVTVTSNPAPLSPIPEAPEISEKSPVDD
jgi:hypothetical protein